MNLSQWYLKNTTKPLLISVLVIVALLLLYNFTQYEKQLDQRDKALNDVVELASLGLAQKNRVLIESTLNLAVNNLHINQIVLCENNQTLFAYPKNINHCYLNNNSSLFITEVRKSALGIKNVELIFSFSWLSQLSLLLYSAIILLLITSVFVFSIGKLKSKFNNEILNPLSPEFIGLSDIEEIQNIITRKNELEKYKVKSAVGEAIELMAAQISHDIRSPLSALSSMLTQIVELPEQQKNIINNAITRINDIANDLLTKRKEMQSNQSADLSIRSIRSIRLIDPILNIELLSPVIESIIEEKRIQYKENNTVEIVTQFKNSHNIFANINVREFQRVLSNLLNNSIEAMTDTKGYVTVNLNQNQEWVFITIQDTGKGIAPHILKNLGQLGITHGKSKSQSGNGLGLYHAIKTIESFNGQLEIASTENVGTTITIKLPTIKAPDSFAEISDPMSSHQTAKTEKHRIKYDAVLIDDDFELIINMWKISAQSNNKKLITFQDPKDFINQIDEVDKNTPIYIDSNLGNGVKGQDIAKLIFDLGFKEIYLATGYQASEFFPMPWIKGIVGKTPPWK